MDALTPDLAEFIESQPIFFVATAAAEGRVNMSPKALDSLRVVSPQRIVWLSLTGSGNETAAHVAANGRMTLMFSSFSKMPLTLRVFGTAKVIHPRDPDWAQLLSMFPTLGGSRQIFDLTIDHVTTACGTSMPIMTINSLRADEELEPFYAAMEQDEIDAYWAKKNSISIDGFPTHIFED